MFSETCRALRFLIALRAISAFARGSHLERCSYSGFVEAV